MVAAHCCRAPKGGGPGWGEGVRCLGWPAVQLYKGMLSSRNLRVPAAHITTPGRSPRAPHDPAAQHRDHGAACAADKCMRRGAAVLETLTACQPGGRARQALQQRSELWRQARGGGEGIAGLRVLLRHPGVLQVLLRITLFCFWCCTCPPAWLRAPAGQQPSKGPLVSRSARESGRPSTLATPQGACLAPSTPPPLPPPTTTQRSALRVPGAIVRGWVTLPSVGAACLNYAISPSILSISSSSYQLCVLRAILWAMRASHTTMARWRHTDGKSDRGLLWCTGRPSTFTRLLYPLPGVNPRASPLPACPTQPWPKFHPGCQTAEAVRAPGSRPPAS